MRTAAYRCCDQLAEDIVGTVGQVDLGQRDQRGVSQIGDAGFGAPVFGLHLYTWCLMAFACQIAASAVLLIALAFITEKPLDWRWTNATAVALAVVVVANLLSVIAEAGLNWDLPPNPVEYLLFK